MKVRFHVLPTVLLAAFVVVLTAGTIAFSIAKLRGLAEESARATFSLIAQRNVDQLHGLLADAGAAVQAQSMLEPERVLLNGQVNQPALIPALVTTLRDNPRIYSVYYGFNDGAFLQVIGVRGDARIANTLQAPAATEFAVRFIDPAPTGSTRREHWQFLAANEKSIGSAVRDSTYVPGTRPWYDAAKATPGLHVTEPYVYESLRGLGLTLSRALAGGAGVFGADLALGDLESYAASSLEGRDGGIVVTGGHGQVLAAHASQRFSRSIPQLLQPVARSTNPLYAAAADMLQRDGSRIETVDGKEFAYASRSVVVTPTVSLHVVAFAPMSLYTGPIDNARNGIVLLAAVILVIFLPLSNVVARRISGGLAALTSDAERIQRLDFSGDKPVHSIFQEIDLLGTAQHTMKTAIRERTEALDASLAKMERLLESGTQLAARRSRDTVMQQTLDSARRLVDARTGQFWLCTRDDTLRLAATSQDEKRQDDQTNAPPRDMELSSAGAPTDPCVWVVTHGQPLRLDRTSQDFDMRMQRLLLGGDPQSLLVVPVLAHGDQAIGVIALADARQHGSPAAAFDPGLVRYAETLAAQSGIALENIELLESQRVLMDSMLQLLASAIDAKSAYTGGHCARVPELARMLAEAACEMKEGPLADFRFETEDEWREFRIGTWLHDCGKITTPEYVIDKATKLETIFNRIHEIRTRFEVLLRDAEIERLNALLAGADPAATQQACEATRLQLIDDFAFVAKCNVGGESMLPEHLERLRAIAQKTWLRHFDDRIGLSHAEEGRLDGLAIQPLPVVERLLADKPEHIVPRTDQHRYDDRYGFRMQVPEHLYNFGELYNLSIGRGTLTAEERYTINEHIVQTVVLLEQLPLPPELKRVPEYACTHHETLTGSGYPRGLGADELSVPARIMAIADIFEALTASDRPYKKPKSLSESIRILASLKAQGHIDADLFNLFLTSGVYERYAEIYLSPDQIDEIDVKAYSR
ncbi:MAG TPA: HD domain-containing phosphohydrolase [Bordetella sp.]|nr:HD domain-containing phosphohydrolase [Bordetella sp.]